VATRGKSKRERERIKADRKKKKLRAKQIRDRDLVRQYTRKVGDIRPGLFEWKVESLRKDHYKGVKSRQDISGLVETLTWQEDGESNGLTGTLSMRKPETSSKITFGDGHQVILSVKWAGSWREVWRMRVWKPSETLPDGTAEFELADDFKMLAVNMGDFEYKKDKKRNKPKGWKSHEIVKDVAKKYKIRLGRIPKGKTDMTISMKNKSVADLLKEVYKNEREETGRRYILRWQNGKLYVLPLKRQPYLYTLEKQIQSATVTKERNPSKFMTVANVSASYPIGNGRKKKKTEFTVVDRKRLKRYGYIRKNLDIGEVKSRKEAIKKAKAQMSRIYRKQTNPTFTVEHTGIPFIRRGDGVRVVIKEFGIEDKRRRDAGSYKQEKEFKQRLSTVFVSSISHTLSAGEYTMTPEFTVDDAVADYHDEYRKFQDKRKRESKRKKRKEKKK
jgi:hypothetical protein